MKIRTVAGLGAILCLLIAINVMVWRQNPFSLIALLPLAGGGILGAVWFTITLVSAMRGSTLRGRSLGGLNAVLSSTIFFGICVMLYLFVQSWDVSWDLTQEGRRELSPLTIQVLQSMTKEVEAVGVFVRVDEDLVLIARDKTMRFLKQCQKYTDLLKVRLLDPDVNRGDLQAMGVTHVSMQGTVIIRSGGRQRVITLEGGSPRLEERDFTNALVNVLRDSEPKVYFLTGHQERDIFDEHEQSGGSVFGNLLRGESYQTELLDISIIDPVVPADCDVLVINNPGGDLHPQEVRALEAYLAEGGRMLLLMDPWKGVVLGHSGEEHLRPFLEERYGIRIGSDVLLTDQQDNGWRAELTHDNTPYQDIDEGFGEYRGAFLAGHPVTRSFDRAMLLEICRTVGAAEEVPDGVVVRELLRSPPHFWAETDVAGLADGQPVSRDAEERGGPLPLAVAAVARPERTPAPGEEARETRIVAVGDAAFASNAGFGVEGHLNFLMNAMGWLTERQELIAIRPTGKTDPVLMLSLRAKRSIAWVSILCTLQLVLVAGLIVYVWRRQYR